MQAEAAKEANVEAIIFARSEADPNANSPPNARVYGVSIGSMTDNMDSGCLLL